MADAPPPGAPDATPLRGPIAWMARNSVAANLLMFVMVIAGLMGLFRTKQEVFPDFSLDIVNIGVPYPGASPAEVEQGITLAVEEAVRGVEGIQRVTSSSAEGGAVVSGELILGADPDRVLADVKSAVDRVTTLPLDAEEPTVALASRKREVISIVLSGDHPLRALHDLAESARAELLTRPGVTQVELQGVPPVEIAIEVPRERLLAYGLTLDDIARQVQLASLELPGGAVESEGGQILVRVADRRRTAAEFAGIVVRGTERGAQVRLGDIATITDGYADTKQSSYFRGKPAVRLTAYRVGTETPIGVAEVMRAYADELDGRLPDTVEVDVWRDDSELLAGRIDLLMRNAQSGLILVALCLALFLDLRLAFWVAAGIPTSVLAAFLVGPYFGLSINMVSLFAFIITLGIVVDDAIVVSENFWEKVERGVPRVRAAIEGAQEMLVPVTFSVLTTVAAFAPILFIPGVTGKIFAVIPVVVISVLLVSLAECFIVLPAHLAHSEPARGGPLYAITWVSDQWDRWVRNRVDGLLRRFIDGAYQRILTVVVEYRYATVAAAFALFLLSVGAVASGKLPFTFFPVLEGDLVTATVRLPYGVPQARTEELRDTLESSLAAAIAEMGAAEDVRGVFTRVGEGPGNFGGAAEMGSHLLTIEVALVPSDERPFSSEGFASIWRGQTPPLLGIESFVINSSNGPGAGAAVDLQLSHPDTEVLAQASAEAAALLQSYDQLTNVVNGYSAGKPQLDYTLGGAARALGLSGTDVARQLRAAFFGAEALREQRGRNEQKVMVRLPLAERGSEHDLAQLLVRSPTGTFVPLGDVASFTRGRAPTAIKREDGRRIVNVTGALAPGVRSAQQVLDSLKKEKVPALLAAHPGLSVDFVGQQRSQGETFAALRANYAIALFVIFALIAIPFRSYVQPVIVMAAIPFGFVGAVAGHLVLGYELSIISMMGIIALGGVVVNDSIVLVDAYNTFRAEGMTVAEAARASGTRRFRPVLLTSLTTFLGLAPMIAETSVQARFLIPMAISLAFGILFTTVFALTAVPAMILMVEDGQALAARLGRRLGARPGVPDPRPAR
jgi:multidrug efflux pump subunit AcrB